MHSAKKVAGCYAKSLIDNLLNQISIFLFARYLSQPFATPRAAQYVVVLRKSQIEIEKHRLSHFLATAKLFRSDWAVQSLDFGTNSSHIRKELAV